MKNRLNARRIAMTAAKEKRTALLIRCSEKEASQIREGAELERRTLSGYVLRAVMNRLATQEKLRQLPRFNHGGKGISG